MNADRVRAWTMQWHRCVPDVLRRDLRCLNGLDWRIVALLFVAAFCFALHTLPATIFLDGLGLHASAAEYGCELASWFVRYVVQFGPVLLALTIADNLPLAGRKRLAALAVALVIGAQFQWPIRCIYEPQSESACTLFPQSPWESWKAMSHNTVVNIAFAMPLAFVAFSRRRELRVRRALHAAEVERIELQRKTLEADLRGMQAQIEPAFLLETLRHIGKLCDDDPPAGAQMLDELIAYLRAALPDLRATQSTLRNESALGRAYLAIFQLRSGGRLDVKANVDESILDAAMPSMVLLPLLAAASRFEGGVTSTDGSPGTARSMLGFDARLAEGDLRIEVAARGPRTCDLARAPIVHEIRARLRALYGERASVDVESLRDAAAKAIVTIPHERV